MSGKDLDDLEAVRQVADALKPFDAKAQERILRWAREKLGLAIEPAAPALAAAAPPPPAGGHAGDPARPKDIKSFVQSKNPQSDNQFAATVAYFYRFEAPEAERKTTVTAEDIQDATRKAGVGRLNKPGQTLLNAHGQGYFDKAERGHYALSTVGENLVAMALPQGSGVAIKRKAKAKAKAKRSTKKK